MSYEKRLFAKAKNNDKEAFTHLCTLAKSEQRTPLTLLLVGKCYHKGWGVKADEDEALKYYMQYARCEIIESGEEWNLYKKAKSKDNPEYSKKEQYLKELEKLAKDKNNRLASILLGKYYYSIYIKNKSGSDFLKFSLRNILARNEGTLDSGNKKNALEKFAGIEEGKVSREWELYYKSVKENKDALEELQQLALSNPPNALAIALLGKCYYSGDGVCQDLSLAVEYFKKAADLGEALGMNALGDIYARNLTGETDPDKGANYYFKAAKKNISGSYCSGYAFKSLIRMTENLRYPNETALHKIAICYEHGYGMKHPDPLKAMEYYKKLARAQLRRVENKLSAGQDITAEFQKISVAYQYMLRNTLRVLLTQPVRDATEEEVMKDLQTALQSTAGVQELKAKKDRIAELARTNVKAKYLNEYLQYSLRSESLVAQMLDDLLHIKKAIPEVQWKRSPFLGIFFVEGKPNTIKTIEPYLAELNKSSHSSIVFETYSQIRKAMTMMGPDFLRHRTTSEFYERQLGKLKSYSLLEDPDDMDSLGLSPTGGFRNLGLFASAPSMYPAGNTGEAYATNPAIQPNSR